jgi:hypothetical protein
MGFVAVSVLAICPIHDKTAIAATKTISWSDGVCNNRMAFEPGQVDEERLKNTIHLLFGPADFEAPWVSVPFTLQDISKLDLDGNNAEMRRSARSRRAPSIPGAKRR